MLQWAPYPFIRIALSFIAGILLYTTIGEGFEFIPQAFAFFVLLFLGLYLYSRKYRSAGANTIVGIAGLLCFAAGGFWVTQLRTPHLQPSHIVNLTATPTYYTGTVADYIIQKPGYQRTVLEVDKVLLNGTWQPVTGQVQVSLPHDTPEDYGFTYGDQLLVKGAPKLVPDPLNPNQFNYKAYLQQKGIYHQHSLRAHQFAKTGNDSPNKLLYISIQLRRYLDRVLKERVPSQREYSIASALVLGVKDELDNAVRDSYAATGTMHVLAVSGLHVGLLFAVLMLLFNKVNLGPKQRWLYGTVVLGGLWLYAFVTGLSPSVLRAVLMFSLVTVSLVISRRHNVYNTLAIAAAILLFINPYYLFEVGFQLSFLAVLGIVALQPGIYSLLEVNKWLPDKVWELISIAVAAQLITLPLGIYYFHQFPVYFWIANVFVVPAATLVLYTGMAALAVSWLPWISDVAFALHFGLIWLMNEFNVVLSNLPYAVLNGMDISVLQTWLLYSLLALFVLFLMYKRLWLLTVATAIVAILSVQQITETITQQNLKMLAVYSLRGQTAISFIHNQKAVIVTDSAMLSNRQNYTFNVQPHLWQLGIAEPEFYTFSQAKSPVAVKELPDGNQLLAWQGKTILLIRQPLKVITKQPLHVDLILLTQNAAVTPQTLQGYTYNTLVFDGNYKPWLIKKTKEAFAGTGIKIHDVSEAGALVKHL